MPKCLGIYIESNIIKYAKVSKEHENIKIESYGVRFYDNALGTEIKKIIEETYSFNTPISVNLSNENYLYFDIFALLSKKDIEKTIEIEFETLCEEKRNNKNAFDTNYALMKDVQNDEKLRAMYMYINKIELNRQIQAIEGAKNKKVVPLPIAISNLLKTNQKENALIVNMEETTTITTIIDQNVYDVEKMEVGSLEVLDKVNQLENSYSKAYEICKNTTIYTAEMDDSDDEQMYLQYIIPVVFNIAQKVQEIADEKWRNISKIYLTGTLASINNIDLYFQEFLGGYECQILRPYFLNNVASVNIKDYVEVNSATSLALNGVGEGIQAFNFPKDNTKDFLKKILTMEIGGGKSSDKKDAKSTLDASVEDIWLIRGMVAILIVLITFVMFSKLLQNGMEKKLTERKDLQGEQQQQISIVETNINSLNSKENKYKELINEINELEAQSDDIKMSRNLITTFLKNTIKDIPDEVMIASVENKTDKRMTIYACAVDYEDLGYFIATLKINKILNNVVASGGNKITTIVNGQTVDLVYVTIEGDLP